MNKTILIAGITGRQGSAVAEKLQANHWQIKGLTRTLDSLASKKLNANGVEMVQGDMTDIGSLEKAMEGCYGVYSVQNYWESGRENEIQFGKNMAQAAKNVGIQHFVFGSCQSCDRKTGVEHFDSKYEIEKEIHQLGLPATILRPVAFMENYYIRDVYKRILNGKLADPVSANKTYQILATEDIGNYVTAVFKRPDLIGKTVDLVGDEVTNTQAAQIMTNVMGFPVKYQKLPMLAVKLLMGKEFHTMFKWLENTGFNATMDTTQKLIPEVIPMNLQEWLLNENWNRWNKKGKF